MTAIYLGRLVKKLCIEVGVTGRIGSLTLLKTFARINHEMYDVLLPAIMTAVNPDAKRTTARYPGLVEFDVAAVFANESQSHRTTTVV